MYLLTTHDFFNIGIFIIIGLNVHFIFVHLLIYLFSISISALNNPIGRTSQTYNKLPNC